MKIIRRILIGVICMVALALLLNYLSVARLRQRDGGDMPPMISTEVRRAAEGVEVFVRKGSELRFTVRARRLQETIQDGNFLEEIEASDFNQDGSIRNSIYSDRAVYDPGRKILDFDGDVRVFLSDGIELSAESMHYNLDAEIGDIPGKVEFLSGSVSGRARDVRFFRDEDRLELGGEVDFSLSRDNTAVAVDVSEGEIRAVAEGGTFLAAENRIFFSGGTRVESPDMGALSAEAVEIELDDGRSKITYMTASGKAAYEMRSHDGTRFVSGGKMVFTAGATGALEKALISEHANLLVKSADGDRTLRAMEIEMLLDPATGAISEIRGTTGANLNDRRGVGETLAEGDVIYAAFADTGGRLRNVHLSGGSRFALAETGKAANELYADTINAHFRVDSDGIENLTADGGVRWIFEPWGADGARALEALKLEIRYAAAGNYPESGEASGAVMVEETAMWMTRRLKAERMSFDFFSGSGQIKSLIADNNVSTVYERAAVRVEPVRGGQWPAVNSQVEKGDSYSERYEASSDSLEAFFTLNNGAGTLWRAAQRGNFRFISDGRSASADRSEYDADNRKIILTGSPEILDVAGRVSGDLIEYDLGADELLARGRVRAVLDARQSKGALFQAGFQAGGGASPVVVTAEEFRYRAADERFQFSGGVVTLTENQQLYAREIVIDGDGNMTATGNVVHRIQETDTTAVIESGRMEYRNGESVIRYSDKVEMKSKELVFSADVFNATLDEEAKGLRRVLAEGNVFVRHDVRVCRGDAAEWVPALSSYVVTGNPAIIDDPARGRSMARRLVYFQGEDRVTLEP